MYDQYNRHIHYLRISVTDRCNLRCRYCMPEDGIQLMNHEDILSFEEIRNVVEVAVSMGIDKIRITGGEPLVRKGIVDLVAMLASVKGINDLAMTTNGVLLDKFAGPLKMAGLQRVNISLDTTDPERYSYITRGGEIADVYRGIDKALEAGLTPVKINCVTGLSSTEEDAHLVKEFAHKKGLEVRFIRQMDLKSGEFSIVEGGEGGNCSVCNRLRLTANGRIKPCLFSENEYSVRELGAEKAFSEALNAKPLKGCFNRKGAFYNIGG
ncbi:MAG TPA: radical SAM protein [Bacteroidales bacterium]|nr:radical SAM protein [Bacteroidales bacterium]